MSFRAECFQSPTLCVEPLSRQITGPKGGPIIILLNGHSIIHFPSDLLL